MANPTTNFGWVMPTSASLVTNLPADFNVFGQAVDTSMQYLLGGTTGQVLSKTSGTNMAFTWTTPTDQTPLTTKGDLFTFSTVDARLAVGTNKYVLGADSTQSTGLAWQTSPQSIMTTTGDTLYASAANTPARLGIGSTNQVLTVAGGVPTWATPASGGSMTLLSTTSLTGAATITISSISQSYTNLYILITGLTVTTGTYTLKLRPGASNANNYSNLSGGTIAASGPDYISPGNAGHSASSAVNDYALTIYNYTDTTARKPFHMVGIAKMASQVEPFGVSALGATNVTAALSSFELSNDSGGNFTAGTVKIYGVN